MRETRILLAVCTNDQAVVCISDLDNDELQAVCNQVNANNIEGIGMTWENVAYELYPNALFNELCENGEQPFLGRTLYEINSECVASIDDLSISVVQSEV